MRIYVELKCTMHGRKNTVKLEPDGEMHYLQAIYQAKDHFPYHRRVLALVADKTRNNNAVR